MRRINKLILLFFTFLVLIIFATIELLQSRLVGKSASDMVNKVLSTRLDASINFSSVELKLFPPGVRVNDLNFKLSHNEIFINVNSSYVGAYFDLQDIFQDKPTISELAFDNLVVKLDGTFNEGKDDEKIKRINIEEYLDLFSDHSPLKFKKVNITNGIIEVLNETIYVDDAKVKIYDKRISAQLDISSFSLSEYPYDVDSIALSLSIDNDNINLHSLKLKKELAVLDLSGRLKNDFDDLSYLAKFNLKADIGDIHNYIDLTNVGQIDYGLLNLSGEVKGSGDKYTINTNLSLEDFLTDFVKGKSITSIINLNESAFEISELTYRNKKSLLSLTEPLTIANFESSELFPEEIKVNLDDFALSDGLYYLRDVLDILNVDVSGDIKVLIKGSDVLISSSDELELSGLTVGEKENYILSLDHSKLVRPTFSISNGVFSMDAVLRSKKTDIRALGRVSGEDISFKVNKGFIDLSDFGRFAGFNIMGHGSFNLNVFDDNGVRLKIDSNLSEFNFDNYYLESLNSSVEFDFDKSVIDISDVAGNVGKARLSGFASINYENLDINADIKLDSKRYLDVKRILSPLLGELDFIPEDTTGDWFAKTLISGKVNLKDLVVKSDITTKNNYIFNESIDEINVNLNLINEMLSFENVKLRKSTGRIEGSFSQSLTANQSFVDFKLDNIPLRELAIIEQSPVELDALLSGRVSGELGDNFNINSSFSIFETFIGATQIKSSKFNFDISDQFFKYDLNLFGSDIIASGVTFFKNDKISKGELVVSTDELPLYLSLLRFVDRSSLSLDARANFFLKYEFPETNLEKLSLSLLMKRFKLFKENINIDYYYSASAPQIDIIKGSVNNWDLRLQGRSAYFLSRGSGDFSGRYSIENDFKVEASILEVFNKVISKADGTIRGKYNLDKSFFLSKNEASLSSNNLAVSTNLLPTEFKQIDFLMTYVDNEIKIKKFNADLSTGKLKVDGNILLSSLIPTFNLKATVDNVGFPILRKSNVVLSSSLNLSGRAPPYSLSGEASIERLNILNDVNDFTSREREIIQKKYDFLPTYADAFVSHFLNFNLRISTKNPILLTNSFADVGMIGRLHLLGTEKEPRMLGSLELAPRTNKIAFKNNDYVLSKGSIFFNDQSKISNPELDFMAQSLINEYTIVLKVFGPVDNFSFDLSSSPALTQEDIFSLIAFGYTKDLSANLTDAERESMTQAGVGSILFDSFKINETLKNQFGLQVNLGTQLRQDETSLLNQRNDGTRVRSATTLEIRKRLSDAMNLSVSSTVGGSAGQRQSMNLNYTINNKLSIEGVYETITAPEGEEAIINDTSLGADVKMRWSFK